MVLEQARRQIVPKPGGATAAATRSHGLLCALVDSDAAARALSLSTLPLPAVSPPPFMEARS